MQRKQTDYIFYKMSEIDVKSKAAKAATTEINFQEKWDGGDVCFLVEETKVYGNKLTLSMWSPVFKALFTLDFKEKTADEIPLPEKKANDFIILMKFLHPPSFELNSTNVRILLPLADEYQIDIQDRCENVLLNEDMQICSSPETCLLAQNFNFQKLFQKHKEYLKSTVPVEELQRSVEFQKLNADVICDVLFAKHSTLKRKHAGNIKQIKNFGKKLCSNCSHGSKVQIKENAFGPYTTANCEETGCDQKTCKERLQEYVGQLET